MEQKRNGASNFYELIGDVEKSWKKLQKEAKTTKEVSDFVP